MTAKKGEIVATTTRTIVRYNPPNEIVGRRELTVQDTERLGIFTQTQGLQWDREKGFWLDAEEAGISPEMLAWIEDPANNQEPSMGTFTVERQNVGKAQTPAAPKEGD